MNKRKFILLAVLFAAFIAAAAAAYGYLSENYSPESGKAGLSAEQSSEEENNQQAEEESSQELMAAPDFTVLDKDGKSVKLSDYFGKPVIINFWATWCGPCKSELPAFDKVSAEYKEEISFLMVNLTDGSRETVEGVKEFIEENDYEFPVYYDTEYSASYAYGTYSIPLTVFINSKGEVLGSHTGAMSEETLRMYIQEVERLEGNV